MINPSPVQPQRIKTLNQHAICPTGKFILYWMNNSIRTRHNAALEQAAHLSATNSLPLRAAFLFDTTAPDGKPLPARHASFLLQGLRDVHSAFKQRKIPFAALMPGLDAATALPTLAHGAAAVVTDTSYLSPGIMIRRRVADALDIPLYVVEADVVVPVETASNKAEHAARTIRPKITRLLKDYLHPLKPVKLPCQSEDSITCDTVNDWIEHATHVDKGILPLDLSNIDDVLHTLDGLDRDAPPVSSFTGGQTAAQNVLRQFLKEKLATYCSGRNEPAKQLQSDLSPYLRAGNISPIDITLQTKAAALGKKSGMKESVASFLEELIIRRELAVNACWFNPNQYDVYTSIVPTFAQTSLAAHKSDKRGRIYSYAELEAGVTNDAFWNAVQLELVVRGKQHGYMRMYWAKQIIGWVEDPATAMEYALRLNNRWELDAIDPNSYVGIAWCFGLHDQGWRERPIWGKVRFMNEAGLRRKFDMAAYVTMVDRMIAKDGLPKHIADIRQKHKSSLQQNTIPQTLKRSRSKRDSQAANSTRKSRKR